ncbi:sugar ABC transporter permease [Oscillospiraceae bacterium HV4-5-C5C]|nr:sugar ABC transporter permease [Oscillospiraceae bacterium HV4-5-C5C]
MMIATVLVILFFTIATGGKLLYPQNVNNLIAQNAYVFVIAAGMLLCILTGGNIDLSVGSIVCLVGAIGATMMVKQSLPIWLAIIVMLLAGLAIGVLQGYLIAYIKVPPFICTLAGMLMWRGLSNVVLEGLTISPMPEPFLNLFNSYVPDMIPQTTGLNETAVLIGVLMSGLLLVYKFRERAGRSKKGYENVSLTKELITDLILVALILFFMIELAQYKGIPVILIWVAAILAIYGYITSKTTIGRHLYAVGGNQKATKLSGINTKKVFFFAYANVAFLAAVTAMITMARLNSANPTAGTNYEMDAIGACFIGGASAYGGSGTIGGVIIGATLMGVLNLGMSIMGVDANWQKVVKGAVLLAAVIFDVVSKKKSE